MSITKKQHFVSEFYLKPFSNLKKQIWVFDKTTESTFLANINNVAQERYFYEHESVSSSFGDQFIEKQLSKLESTYSYFISKLRQEVKENAFVGFTPEDRQALSSFVYYQKIRTKENRLFTKSFFSILPQALREKGFSDNEIQQHTIEENDLDIKKLQLESLLDSKAASETINDLTNRVWFLSENKTKFNFITSDNPVIGHLHEELTPFAYELFIPLDSEYGLTIANNRSFEGVKHLNNKLVSLTEENVKFYNSHQVVGSTRQIFDQSSDFAFPKKILLQNSFLPKRLDFQIVI